MELFDNGIHNRALINIQCDSIEQCLEVKERYGDSFITGITASSFTEIEDGVALINKMHENKIKVSVGLGNGSAAQWSRALELAKSTNPVHLNQVYPASALSVGILQQLGYSTLVNALIKPTGRLGYVNIATGPVSERQEEAVIPIDTLAAILSEVGVKSVKFFPIDGMNRLDELNEVAIAVAKYDMIMEPTGGITPENVGMIVKTCVEAGVRYVMPHLYSSLKDTSTGRLDMEKIDMAYQEIIRVYNE